MYSGTPANISVAEIIKQFSLGLCLGFQIYFVSNEHPTISNMFISYFIRKFKQYLLKCEDTHGVHAFVIL